MSMVKCLDIKKYFYHEARIVKAVDGVSLDIKKGDSFGVVGESGSGKTTLGKLILGILDADSGRIMRGAYQMQVIFQDPYNSLDPKMKIFDILAEGLIIRRASCVPRTACNVRKKVENILDLVRLPKNALSRYPHQFSGGERQRIAVGRAVITSPEFIVCDEPVSSLDVTIQLEILDLLKNIHKSLGMTYLFISHDLKVVKYMCNKLAVMKAGRIVETGYTEDIYSNPSREYTRKLLSSSLTIIP